MDKNVQDRLWASLSKEERKRHRDGYRAEVQTLSYNSGFNDALAAIFGAHNLTSDTEPEELLYVPKRRVQQYLEGIDVCIDVSDLAQLKALRIALTVLFGKNLPNKEHNEDNFAKSEPSVQGEPKFRKGERVKIADIGVKTFGNIATITHCEVDEGKIFYWLNDDIGYYSEHQLEPYTEPKTKEFIASGFEAKGEAKGEAKELNRRTLYNALCELETASIKVRKALIAM